jgi:iron complex transport system substrate-binding protein
MPSWRACHVLAVALVVGTLLPAGACRRAEAAAPSSWPTQPLLAQPAHNLTDRCVGNFEASLDYFPEKATVSQATSFRVAYHRHYKVVDFVPQIGSQEVIRYLLVQCGAPAPDMPGARVVRVPVRRFVSTKVEVAGAIARLGIVDRLVGVNSMRPIVVPEIVERYRRGQIEEVGTGTHSTIELAMAVVPDIVFTFYSAFADANVHTRLWEAGVVGVPLGDHFEATPLGRAEWMKFMALFFNVEGRATEAFDAVAARYGRLRKTAAGTHSRPGVLLGGPSTRTRWALNGGRNYFARLIEDAGGRYVWTSDSSRSLDLADFEQVFEAGTGADYWLAYVSGARTVAAIVDDEPRLRAFGPVVRRGVYYNDKGRVATGGYPLANDSVARPDELLADLIRILHPELMPDQTLTYHYKVP